MRRAAGWLGLGLALLYSRSAEALPSLEVSTSLGGAEASEYLVRVANPDARESSGVIELRAADDRAVARAPYSVPGHSTRYFRIPGERGMRLGAVAIASDSPADAKPVRAQERYGNDGAVVIFDIPPRDDARLHELRVHSGTNAVISHAVYDETTHEPLLTRRAAVYDGVALVLVPSATFLALPDAERDALTTWVRAGGSIAFSISDEAHRARLPGLGGGSGGGRGDGSLGLGHVHVLPFDPWSSEANGDISIQEKLVTIAQNDRQSSRSYGAYGDPWMDVPNPTLDPNQGYRSVLGIVGVLLVAQALVTAFAFRRIATRRGMGAAYRFVVGSSAATFAAVIGLGIYAKGGFGARARELSFADAASGESVAWVSRNRTYFASSSRTIDVSPRDPSNVLGSRDPHAVLRGGGGAGGGGGGNDAQLVLGDVGVRPWQTTAVTEHGTTTIGNGVRVEYEGGNVVVRNDSGATLRNVIVAVPYGVCLSFGDIANGETQTQTDSDGVRRGCTPQGPEWAMVRSNGGLPSRITLFGEIEEAPTSMDGFRLEKRTTLLRVTGGAS